MVKQLIVERRISPPSQPLPGELILVPASFGYWPKVPESQYRLFWGKRWQRDSLDDLPRMVLTNDRGGCGTENDRAARDVVQGFGSPSGSATLAALLLDIGLPDNEGTEFCLEGPAGYQSVAPRSAEGRFWVGFEYS
jgi:hypothetical protein